MTTSQGFELVHTHSTINMALPSLTVQACPSAPSGRLCWGCLVAQGSSVCWQQHAGLQRWHPWRPQQQGCRRPADYGGTQEGAAHGSDGAKVQTTRLHHSRHNNEVLAAPACHQHYSQRRKPLPPVPKCSAPKHETPHSVLPASCPNSATLTTGAPMLPGPPLASFALMWILNL